MSVNHAVRAKGQPTFSAPGSPSSPAVFTIRIWGRGRSKFGALEVQHLGKRVCATGMIQSYKGKAEIGATQPSQIRVR